MHTKTFRFDDDIHKAMERLFERDGISPSEQARRALTAFLIEKGVLKAPKKGRS
jgi:predicted transcriptional regulator